MNYESAVVQAETGFVMRATTWPATRGFFSNGHGQLFEVVKGERKAFKPTDEELLLDFEVSKINPSTAEQGQPADKSKAVAEAMKPTNEDQATGQQLPESFDPANQPDNVQKEAHHFAVNPGVPTSDTTEPKKEGK
jgi:hypothetical protein